jgi:predicted HicB family RNase H-like nuclease
MELVIEVQQISINEHVTHKHVQSMVIGEHGVDTLFVIKIVEEGHSRELGYVTTLNLRMVALSVHYQMELVIEVQQISANGHVMPNHVQSMVIGEYGVDTLFVTRIVEVGHSQELGYVTTLNLQMVAHSVHYQMELVIEVQQISINEHVMPKHVQAMVIGERGVLTLFVTRIVEEGRSQELGYVTTLNLQMVAHSVHYQMELVIKVQQISVNEHVTPKHVQSMAIGEYGVDTLFVIKIVEEGRNQELGYVTTLNLQMVDYSVHYQMELVIEVQQISVNEHVMPKHVQPKVIGDSGVLTLFVTGIVEVGRREEVDYVTILHLVMVDYSAYYQMEVVIEVQQIPLNEHVTPKHV